jgi:hypothetical protein
MIIKKPLFITLILFFVILCAGFFMIYMNNSSSALETKEWKNFKKETMSKYPYIKDVSVDGFEIYLNISYILEKEMDRKDVENIFEATRKNLLEKNMFESIQQAYLKQTKYSFLKINIDFYHSKSINIRDYRFNYSIDGGKMTQNDSLKNWGIEERSQ